MINECIYVTNDPTMIFIQSNRKDMRLNDSRMLGIILQNIITVMFIQLSEYVNILILTMNVKTKIYG